MSQLKQHIQDAMKAAMKAQDKPRLGAIRLIMAAIKQREIDEQTVLADPEILAILDKMAKQRRESIAQFQQGGREDLVAVEQAELEVIQSFLPQPLSETALNELIDAAISVVDGAGMKVMGQVMAELKPKIQGRADGKLVSDLVKQKLSIGTGS